MKKNVFASLIEEVMGLRNQITDYKNKISDKINHHRHTIICFYLPFLSCRRNDMMFDYLDFHQKDLWEVQKALEKRGSGQAVNVLKNMRRRIKRLPCAVRHNPNFSKKRIDDLINRIKKNS